MALVEVPDPDHLQRRRMGTLQAELGDVLRALRTHAQSLFDELAQNSALNRQNSRRDEAVATHLAALSSLDKSLVETLSMAAVHQANQARLDPLLAQIKERDTRQRQSIAHIATLRSELQALVDAADEERGEMQRAEDGACADLRSRPLVSYGRACVCTAPRKIYLGAAWLPPESRAAAAADGRRAAACA